MSGRLRMEMIYDGTTCVRDDDTLYPCNISDEKQAYAERHGLKVVDIAVDKSGTVRNAIDDLISAGDQEAAQQRLMLFLLTGE